MPISVKSAPTVTPGSAPSTKVSVVAPKGAKYGAQQIQQLGGAVQQVGSDVLDIELDARKKASDLRVADGMNRLRQRSLDLQYSEKEGYARLKGLEALERPEGISLGDEYSAKFNEEASSIEDGLSNEYQREQFAKMAKPLRNQFSASTQAHSLKEYNTYNTSVQDGAIALAEQEATSNWNQPHVVDNAINGVEGEDGKRHGGIMQSIYNKAKLSGKSANEAEAIMKASGSAVHAKVITLALDEKNPAYAMSYFKSNRKSMVADDLLKVRGILDTEMDNHLTNIAVSKAQTDNAKSFAKNNIDRLRNITLGEDADSEKTIALDKSLRASGGDLSQALVTYAKDEKYVNKAKAKAKEKYGDDTRWLEFTSKATRVYVEETMGEYKAGKGTSKMPTKYEFEEQAVEALGENPRLDLATKVRKQAGAKYDAILEDGKQRADFALENAQRELIANGGDMTQLTPSVRSELIRYDMGKLEDANSFAKSIREGVSTDIEMYSKAISNPSHLALMNEAEFNQMLNTSFSTTDQKKIVQLRADAVSGKGESADSINDSAFNNTVNNYMQEVGIDPKKDAKKSSTIKTYLYDEIYKAQRAEGRKFSPKELQDFIADQFAKSNLQDTWFADPDLVLDMTIGDIPSKDADQLKRALQIRGIANPTDAMVVRSYWQRKNRQEK